MPTLPGSRGTSGRGSPVRVSWIRMAGTAVSLSAPGRRYPPRLMPPGSALDILVVDDDDALRDMLTRSFGREGHRITSVADGHGALDEASRGHFDVILLDVALGPGPTGYDIARALRARRNVTPVIMLTALDSEADAVQGLEAGADDYVTKPFGLAELPSRIR